MDYYIFSFSYGKIAIDSFICKIPCRIHYHPDGFSLRYLKGLNIGVENDTPQLDAITPNGLSGFVEQQLVFNGQLRLFNKKPIQFT